MSLGESQERVVVCRSPSLLLLSSRPSFPLGHGQAHSALLLPRLGDADHLGVVVASQWGSVAAPLSWWVFPSHRKALAF